LPLVGLLRFFMIFPTFFGGATEKMKKKTSDQRPSPAAPPHLCDRSGPPAPTARGTGHAAGAEWWRCRLPPVAGLRLLWLWVKSCQKSIDQMDPNGSNGLRLIHLQKKICLENSLKTH
jgi:hypothetical protein